MGFVEVSYVGTTTECSLVERRYYILGVVVHYGASTGLCLPSASSLLCWRHLQSQTHERCMIGCFGIQVFMPYNYLVDSTVRKLLNLNLEGAILIFDEAHNLEAVCGESASWDLTAADLASAVQEVWLRLQTSMPCLLFFVTQGSLLEILFSFVGHLLVECAQTQRCLDAALDPARAHGNPNPKRQVL